MKATIPVLAMLALAALTQPLRADEPASYKRAIKMMSEARLARNSDARNQKLRQAESELDRFVQANPKHENFEPACIQLGTLRLERARGLIWESRSRAIAGKRGKWQEQARSDLIKAKTAFQQAHDKYEVLYKSFLKPTFDKAEIAKRRASEKGYMQAQLYLAQTRYEEAQTYDIGSDERDEILIDASKQFEIVHEKYRSIVAGLFARMWQGKCFEERDELRKALGIYNELLGHGGAKASPTLQNLLDQVLHFRLICLNHEKKRDYQLVIVEAEAWLDRRKDKESTRTGLGIRWQLAKAYESLANVPNLEADKASKLLKEALAHASKVAKYPGEYADVAKGMVQRLSQKLNAP